MRSYRPLACGLVALAALPLAGCDDAAPHALEVTFGPEVAREELRAVALRVAAGSCAAPGPTRFDTRVERDGATGMAVPALDPGRYAFEGTATDGACRVVAAGCRTVTLPVEGGRVTLELSAVDGGDACQGDVCIEGRCASPDGGAPLLDAGAPDAGLPADDAGPAPPAAPAVIAPWTGVATGSARVAAADPLTDHPRRPLVRWEPSEGAASYRVEWVACAALDPGACDFSSPTALSVADAAATSARPDDALPVETETPPLGARYAFRVGACALPAGAGCAFAAPRRLEVGRVAEDTDGDGVADLYLVQRPASGDDELRRALGLEPSSDSVVVTTAPQMREVAWIGDYDGDGVGELAVVTESGSGRRVRFIDDDAAAGSTAAPGARELTALGDADGDGYADFAFRVAEEVRVQLGGATFDGARGFDVRASAGDVATFALAIARAGDVDGDGLEDLAVASRVAADRVRVDIFALDARVARRLGDGVTVSTGEVGFPVTQPVVLAGGGDMDGDGRPDLAIGRPEADRLTVAFADGRRESQDEWSWQGWGGAALAMGDLDATGRARIAVGSTRATDAFGDTGGVWHLSHTGDPFSRTRIRFFNPERFGAEVAVADLTGNGREDLVSLAETGFAVHVGLFAENRVGGSANFLLPDSGSELVAVSR